MRYIFAVISVLLLSGCPSVLATLGAAAVTRLDGYQSLRATQRDIWLARGQRIYDDAILMLTTQARDLAAKGDYDGMMEALRAAHQVHLAAEPNLPLIPFTGSAPPTFPE